MQFTKDDVSMEEQLIVDVPEHRVVLSFNSDAQAEAFCDWWDGTRRIDTFGGGIESFEKWCEINGENYE